MSDTQVQQFSEHQTQYSDLNAAEWSRYVELIKGPLGFWNPSIDPLLALGMYAETAEQEQRYAERFAEQEYGLTTRALQFQRVYQQAFRRLYPDMPLTHGALLAPYIAHRQQQRHPLASPASLPMPSIMADDKIRVFVDAHCVSCKPLIQRLLRLTETVESTRIDIFILNATSDEAVRQWAHEQGIDPQWVYSQRITLNRDEGLLAQLQSQDDTPVTEPPFIFLQRNDTFYRLRNNDWVK